MKTVAIIPARGGSKGVPGKNLRLVGGKSLLSRAIESAQVPSEVDDILVSTDAPDIQRAAEACGLLTPFFRPAVLAGDTASVADTVRHCIQKYQETHGATIGTVVLLEPTSPFRTAAHVRRALERYRAGNCQSVVSVCPLERKPENIRVKSKGELLEPYILEPSTQHVCRQDMGHLCRINSAVYVFDRVRFLKTNSFTLPELGFIEMTQEESINIDSEWDLLVANALIK